MNKPIREITGYENFKEECRFVKCSDEYPGWTGTEKYIIFSLLTRQEIERKYPEITSALSPYLLEDFNLWLVLMEHKRNDDKFAWRSRFLENGFGFDELTEYVHETAVDDDSESRIIDSIVLSEALNALPEVLRRRVELYYFDGLNTHEIAKLEHISPSAVSQSIKSAMEKIKKFLNLP